MITPRRSFVIALLAMAGLACQDAPTEPGLTGCDITVGAISIGQTKVGRLTPTSCRLEDDTYADRWAFTVDEGVIVTIDLVSEDFDAYLIVRNSDGVEVAVDDDGGGDLNARVTHGFAAGEYIILANAYDTGATGGYTLSIQ